MDNWQQRFERTDPWQEIPFAADSWANADVWVGIACIAAAFIATAFGA